jgi:hypothetical protein
MAEEKRTVEPTAVTDCEYDSPFEWIVDKILEIRSMLEGYNSACRRWQVLHRRPDLAAHAAKYLGESIDDVKQDVLDRYSALQKHANILERLIEPCEWALSEVHGASTVKDMGIEATCWPLWLLRCVKSVYRPGPCLGKLVFDPKPGPDIDEQILRDRLLQEGREVVRRSDRLPDAPGQMHLFNSDDADPDEPLSEPARGEYDRDIDAKVVLAMLHKWEKPSASEAACARAVNIKRPTLRDKDRWKEFLEAFEAGEQSRAQDLLRSAEITRSVDGSQPDRKKVESGTVADIMALDDPDDG